MKTILMTIPADNLDGNETGTDLIVYNYVGDEYPFWISYKSSGDLARMKTWAEVNDWIKKYIIIPNVK